MAPTLLDFVASTNSTTIVAISGTNVSEPLSIAIDLSFPLQELNSSLFPDADGDAKLHRGFQGAFERMATDILVACQDIGSSEVLVTGHSLGGALTLITATYLQQALGEDVIVTAKAFASPRVGNQEWADYVDDTLDLNAKHMVNYDDNVPHVPPQDWGFQQSSNEVWIKRDGSTYEYCSGQENSHCSDSLETPLGALILVSSFISDFDTSAHAGPYAGITITSDNCVDY